MSFVLDNWNGEKEHKETSSIEGDEKRIRIKL
jgi:hypothetical protein